MPRTYWRVVKQAPQYAGCVGYHEGFYADIGRIITGVLKEESTGRCLMLRGRLCFIAHQYLERYEPPVDVLRGVKVADVNGRKTWIFKDRPILAWCLADVILDSQGDRSKTMGKRLKSGLEQANIGMTLDTRGRWKVEYQGKKYPFTDLMTIKRANHANHKA